MTATLEHGDLPAIFHAADRCAVSGQRRFLNATKFRLVMLITAAACGAVSFRPSDSSSDLAAFLAAVAFVGSIGAELYIRMTNLDRTWYECRAVAESSKTLAWRYSVAGEPFSREALGEREADELLIARLHDVLTDLARSDRAAPGEQITPAMRRLRAEPLEARRAAYDTGRLADQQAWYAARSEWNARRASWWSMATVVIELLGCVGALAKATGDLEQLDLVLGLAATAAASFAGWVQAKQYGSLAAAYSLAAQELASIRSMVRWQGDERSWAAFVGDAEEAVSREHTLWRANRGLRAVER